MEQSITMGELAKRLTSLADALEEPETEPEDIAQYLRELAKRLPADETPREVS